MRTVTFKSVVQQIALLANAGSSDSIGTPSNQQSDAIHLLVNRRINEFWHRYWWPFSMRTVFRTFAPIWASTGSYVQGDQVYYFSTNRYYVCTKATSSVTPANSSGVTNTSNWYQLSSSYSAGSYSTTSSYSSGTLVLWLDDGNYYACHTNASAGVLPSDTTKWGLVPRFVKSFSMIASDIEAVDDIQNIFIDDPEANQGALPVNGWTVNNDSITVDTIYQRVWMRYRTRTPDFSGDDWSSTTSYTAGTTVYHDDTGDYWTALLDNTGHTPASGSIYWQVVPFPYDLSRVIVQAVYADMVRRSEQGDRYQQEAAEAERMLGLEIDRYDRQQGQLSRQRVLTR